MTRRDRGPGSLTLQEAISSMAEGMEVWAIYYADTPPAKPGDARSWAVRARVGEFAGEAVASSAESAVDRAVELGRVDGRRHAIALRRKDLRPVRARGQRTRAANRAAREQTNNPGG